MEQQKRGPGRPRKTESGPGVEVMIIHPGGVTMSDDGQDVAAKGEQRVVSPGIANRLIKGGLALEVKR